MNSVVMVGRLCADPSLRYIAGSGKAVCKFDIAVDRRFKTENGPKADFFQVQIWGKPAESVANYTVKGSKVAVKGELQNNNYEKDGVKHYGTVINADQVDFLDSKKDKGEQQTQFGEEFSTDGFQPIEDDMDSDIRF